MTEIVVALVGVALLTGLAVAVAWQERKPPPASSIVYGVEESIEFVMDHLNAETRSVLKTSDVRRMLEWSVHYLQDPSLRPSGNQPAVAGGLDAALYIQDRGVEAGVAYDGDLIVEVLGLQNEYLAALGAVGDVVDNGGDSDDAAIG